jgi:RNA polymerase sigma factor (TIGR02999 family)
VPGSVTALLVEWTRGDAAALERLVPVVEAELRGLARRHMARESPGHTLQPSALVNEAYLRLVQGTRPAWQNRVHFFAVASRVMRRVLVDHARAKRNMKRGGRLRRVPLHDDLATAACARGADLVALDEALDALAAIDPRRGRVVELRVFGGLSVAETAAAMNVSPETVMRDWKLARAWLGRELRSSHHDA